MSSIVTKILSSTVGLLVNKARDSAAAKLSGGDVTDAKIRELVVRELDDVKTKIDGLSLKDLFSSHSFLKQGIDLLNVSLNKSMDEQKDVDKSTDEQAASTMPSSVQSEILNEALALSRAMEKLNIASGRDFEYVKKHFEDARRRATDAFSNPALPSIDHRLMAAKFRIVATILECLESPEHAITSCLSFLKELHGLGEIAEMFSVYFKGGPKSIFNKAQRVECVKSVMLINYTLFQFVSKFSREYISVIAWPAIKLDEHIFFNPILSWQEVSTRNSMGDELPQLHNGLILHENEDIYGCSAVNSHGDVVVVVGNLPNDGSIKIISKTGKSMVVNLPVPSEGDFHKRKIRGLTVDKNNNVYVVSAIYTDSFRRNGYHVLDVLDENYNVKQTTRRLEYLKEEEYIDYVKIAITKNNDIVMIQWQNLQVFVCDNTGKLKHKFKRDSRYLRDLGISGQDEIMIPSDDEKTIQIYSKEGNLKSTIKLPEGHQARSLAFNYVICKIIVVTYVKEKNSFFLLCYTESGELETEMFLCKRITYKLPAIRSHPSGPCVIVREKSIIFI